jgi:hypothetical protein
LHLTRLTALTALHVHGSNTIFFTDLPHDGQSDRLDVDLQSNSDISEQVSVRTVSVYNYTIQRM